LPAWVTLLPEPDTATQVGVAVGVVDGLVAVLVETGVLVGLGVGVGGIGVSVAVLVAVGGTGVGVELALAGTSIGVDVGVAEGDGVGVSVADVPPEPLLAGAAGLEPLLVPCRGVAVGDGCSVAVGTGLLAVGAAPGVLGAALAPLGALVGAAGGAEVWPPRPLAAVALRSVTDPTRPLEPGTPVAGGCASTVWASSSLTWLASRDAVWAALRSCRSSVA
jgi:hypothetical protein